MSLEPVPMTHALDDFLREVVRAIHAAVNRGIASIKTEPAVADKALADSKEIIDTVMAGKVEEWVGEEKAS